MVRVRGQERISYVEEVEVHSKKHGRHTKHVSRSHTNVFLLDRLRLFAFPRAFLKNKQYTFAFAYQTHASLPGFFSLGPHTQGEKTNVRDLSATISYSVRATLDQGHYVFDCRNAHAHCDLVLYSQQLYSSTFAGKSDATTLSQGECEVALSLDRPTYAPGETARVYYHVKNASRVAIRALTLTLFHNVYVRIAKHGQDRISTRVASFDLAGVPPESEANASVDIALVRALDGSQLPPTTTGALIQSRYRVHVHCDIPWALDVTLDLPIVITSPLAAARIEEAGLVPTPVAVLALTVESVQAPNVTLQDTILH